MLQATQTCDIAQEQQRHRAIIYKVYSRRAAALQRDALTAWRAAAAAAQEKAAALRALMLRSKQHRLQAVVDKSASDTRLVSLRLSNRPLSLLHRATKYVYSLKLVGTWESGSDCKNRKVKPVLA